jgi:ankyrin repeat protein
MASELGNSLGLSACHTHAPAQMRLLVEEGGADIGVRDRWGNTPLDEATRVGARPCAAYLQQHAAAVRRRALSGSSSTPLEEAQRSRSLH